MFLCGFLIELRLICRFLDELFVVALSTAIGRITSRGSAFFDWGCCALPFRGICGNIIEVPVFRPDTWKTPVKNYLSPFTR